MPPEAVVPPNLTPPKRGWFRRALRWVGIGLLLVVIFHRPLFHLTVRLALRAAAARMHLALDLRTSGTIFTNLTVEDVRARAEGVGPTPIRLIEIKEVRLDYSLPMLVRHGVGEFLRSYEIHQANLELVALPSKTKSEKQEKVQIAKLLNDILGQPAAYSDRVWIDDFSITVTAPNNVTEVRNVHLRLDPEKAGYLRVARLAIPGVPVWENLSAETSYTDRNFFIKDLRLAPELVLDEVNFDASQRAQNKGSVILKAHAFGGTASLELSGQQLKKRGETLTNAYDTTLKVELAGIAIDRAAAYFKAPPPPVARLARLSMLFTGEPEKPRTWRGNLAARVEAIAAGPVKIDAAGLSASFADGRADVTSGEVTAGRSHIAFGAKIGLPESVTEFPRSDVELALKIDAPDLPALTAMMPDPLNGKATGGGTIILRAGQLRAELALDVQQLANTDLTLASGKVTIQAIKQLDPPPPGPFDGLDGRITTQLVGLRFKTFNLDSARVDLEAHNRFVKLHAAEVTRGENVVSAEGSARIPEDVKAIAKTPVEAQFTIHVPQLGAFGIAAKEQTLVGQIEGSGAVKILDGALTGGVKLEGGGFKLGGFAAERLVAKIDVANQEAVIDQLAIQLNGNDQIVASGKVGLAKPLAYEGGLLVEIKNLAALQPLLEVFGPRQPLSGALSFQWNGKGQLDPPGHGGQLELALTKAKFGTAELSEVRLGGLYTPEFAESKPFKIVAGATSLGGVIEYREAKLRLKDLKFEHGGASVLTGFLYLPFDPSNLKQPIAFDQRIAANINTDKLDLEKLLASFGQPSPVSGAFTANLVAGGTLLQPFAHLKVAAERLQAKAAKQFEPGALALDLHYSNRELTLAATV